MRCHLFLPLLLIACVAEAGPSPMPAVAPAATEPQPAPATAAARPAPVPAQTTSAAARNPDGQRPALGFMPEYDAAVEGVVVGSVREGGPAQRAGIEAGDVIVVLAGQEVSDARSYAEVLDEQTIGSTVPVRIRRGNQTIELKVEIGARQAR